MMFRTLSAASALALIAAGVVSPVAQAQSMPDFDVVDIDVLPGWRTDHGTHMTALRITLAPGWKTYWRAPGVSGIPPLFDMTESSNLGGIDLHWPRPEVFHINGMTTIGYENEVILPMEVTPRSPGDQVTLSGEIKLGVCEDICIPMDVSLNAVLPDVGGPNAAITSALAQQPAKGAGKVVCRIEPISDGLRMQADIPAALNGGEMAVVEIADPQIWVSEAHTVAKGNMLTATVDIVPPNGQPFAVNRSDLRFTVLGNGWATEHIGCSAG